MHRTLFSIEVSTTSIMSLLVGWLTLALTASLWQMAAAMFLTHIVCGVLDFIADRRAERVANAE